MCENSRKIKLYTLVTLVVALIVAVVRTVMLTKIVEPDTGLYIVGTRWGQAFDVGVVVLLAIMIVCGKLLFKKLESAKEPDSTSTFAIFGSALCALMFFSVFIYGIYNIMFAKMPMSTFLKLQIILCLPCGFNHLVMCVKEKREKTKGQALLAMVAPILFAVRVIEVFMDVNSQINTSQRSLELLVLCAIMMFYLYESSFLVNKDTVLSVNHSNYYISALGVVVLTCIAVIPYLLVSVFWAFEAGFVIMDVLECCVMLYALSRLITVYN